MPGTVGKFMTSETKKIPGAKATLYHSAPSWEGERTAAIGDFQCESAEAGALLLEQICSELQQLSVQRVLGPMNGDTWHNYRLVSQSDGSAPFLMEPQSKPQDINAFQLAGFETVAHYFSAKAKLADAIGPAPSPIAGVEISSWDGSEPEAHFAEVYQLSIQAFANNLFYQEISQQAFLAMYLPYVPLLKSELIFMARDAHTNELVGYLFGIPNYGAGANIDTVILKTYASLRAGVGHLLAHEFHRRALESGFEQVIHALIQDDNNSADRSRKHGAEVFRRYLLLGKHLHA